MNFLTSVLVPLLVILGACSARPEVVLPRLGTVGDPPPAAETVEITVLADGTLRVEDAELDTAALLRLLEARTETSPRAEEFSFQPSRLSVLVRCDARTAVRDLIPVLHACHDPAVRISRLFYAVEHEDGEGGAFAWFLPHDSCGCGHDTDPPTLTPTAHVHFGGGATLQPAALYASLRALSPEQLDCLEIHADGGVPVGDVLSTADLCLRAGATGIVLLDWLQEPRESNSISLGRKPLVTVTDDTPRPPPVARMRGPAGFAREVQLLTPVIDDLNDDRIDTDDFEFPVEETIGD